MELIPTGGVPTDDVTHRSSRPSSPTWPKAEEVKDDVKFSRPVDGPKTGTWKAGKFISGLAVADLQVSMGLAVNLSTFLIYNYSQTVTKSATITTNYVGTTFVMTILGGFVADSFLGAFCTATVGGVIIITGLSLLTFVTASRNLQPPPCITIFGPCSAPGPRYMAPLYIALYTISLGTGLLRPSVTALAGDQFDVSIPAEKKQLVQFFGWFYFLVNIGIVIAFTLGVYLQNHVSPVWNNGFSLILFVVFFAIFLMGNRLIRQKRPFGSFLTRMAQVFVTSIRKARSKNTELYDLTVSSSGEKVAANTVRTKRLRFLDRAAIIEEEDWKNVELGGSGRPDRWKLCSVAQVEESKRLLHLLPIWACTTVVTLVFSQLTTFSVQQLLTVDRTIGSFEIPAQSLGALPNMVTFFIVPFYNFIIIPIAKRITGSRYGLTPILRMGLAMIFAVLAMIVAGQVERKRLNYAREGQFELLPFGAYQLSMSFWWFVPQNILGGLVEFFFYAAAYEFFFFETSEETRSVGISFTFASVAVGFFMSSVLVEVVNSVTRNDKGGSWLLHGTATGGQLSNGGLEKFYYFLAIFIGFGFLLYTVAAYFYEYNYDWYGDSPNQSAFQENTGGDDGQHVNEPQSVTSSNYATPEAVDRL